jgi:hypothetical protein
MIVAGSRNRRAVPAIAIAAAAAGSRRRYADFTRPSLRMDGRISLFLKML